MQPFQYTSAKTAQLASKGNQQGEGTYLGGGTTLIDLMKLNVMKPDSLVDVRRISPAEIQDNGSTVLIPSTATNAVVAHSALIMREFPVLSEALLSGASAQLRNVATVAGNVMQKTRCCYYRDTAMRCNKREPGSGCDALEGYNRGHAVLGGSEHCIALNPSDMNVAMAMLDAVVHVVNGAATREIPFIDFHTLPGDHPEIETLLKPGDIITTIEIAKSPLARSSHYLKVRDRASFSFALTSAAVAMDAVAGVVTGARLALGGVGTKPWRAAEAERALVGNVLGTGSYRAAAEVAMKGSTPRKYNSFKVELAKRTIVRAYEELQAKV